MANLTFTNKSELNKDLVYFLNLLGYYSFIEDISEVDFNNVSSESVNEVFTVNSSLKVQSIGAFIQFKPLNKILFIDDKIDVSVYKGKRDHYRFILKKDDLYLIMDYWYVVPLCSICTYKLVNDSLRSFKNNVHVYDDVHSVIDESIRQFPFFEEKLIKIGSYLLALLGTK